MNAVNHNNVVIFDDGSCSRVMKRLRYAGF